MDKVPNDVTNIIFRYLHLSNIVQLNTHFNNTYTYKDVLGFLRTKQHINMKKLYGWRNLNRINFDPCLGDIRNRSNRIVSKIPKRYLYSLNTLVDSEFE